MEKEDEFRYPQRSNWHVHCVFLLQENRTLRLMYQFFLKAAISFLSAIFVQVYMAIYQSLKDVYMRMPTISREWKKLSDEIFCTWQYPTSNGAMDGKHIAMFNH